MLKVFIKFNNNLFNYIVHIFHVLQLVSQ